MTTRLASRLVPASLSVWGAALPGLLLGWQAAPAVGALATLSGLTCLRHGWGGRVRALALVVRSPFALVDLLREVDGIGVSKLAKFSERACT